MKDLVDHLIERLQPGEDGKRKKFHASNVQNISTFLDNFQIRNVTDDAELAQLVEVSKQLLSGVSPDDLRKNEVDRECLTKGFGKVKEFLDTMVETAGSRKIVLEEEPEEAAALVW